MKTTWLRLMERLPARFTIYHWMGCASLFSVVLLAARIFTSGRPSYVFLAWNLFLAYVPLFISSQITRNQTVLNNRVKMVVLIFLWVLFMPNSFYMLTDLFHLENMDNGRPWFDLTLILSFAWSGILAGIVSLRQMEMMLRKTKGELFSVLIICVVMWLNAFGIYIGRFLRFNSWDIFVNPFSLLGEISDMIFSPYDYRHAWVMCFCFAVFMIILYYTVKKMSETFKNY